LFTLYDIHHPFLRKKILVLFVDYKPGKKNKILFNILLFTTTTREGFCREREREIFRREPTEFPSGEGRSAGERKRERERFAGEILQRFCRERLSGEKNKEREDREKGRAGGEGPEGEAKRLGFQRKKKKLISLITNARLIFSFVAYLCKEK
jgi:hypothetical protein